MFRKPHYLVPAFLLCLGAWCFAGCTVTVDEPPTDPGGQAGEYLFCHWNVENFFDDKADKRHHKADVEYDKWFANNPDILKLKLTKLTEALLKMNDGKGPDILAICEVESVRAAELLQEALNKKLEAKYHYKHVLMKEVNGGRHIAPAIITRLDVDKEKTRLHGRLQRMLEGHVIADGKELTIFATHWTSRISSGSEEGRDKYADIIYKAFKEMYAKDAKVRVLICGDFNDTPQDESVVKHLHAIGDVAEVKKNHEEPLLFNCFADKDPAKGFGTHFYNGKWYIFDQIVVSPGMLTGGAGWHCDVASAQTFNELYRPGDTKKRPWRFGDEGDLGARGYSDHFPVMVKLRVK
jgi:endonuclease/exonuclease/phosphatase family metal-dependent hydrolase